jgi:hypothetical protein
VELADEALLLAIGGLLFELSDLAEVQQGSELVPFLKFGLLPR